MNCQECESTIRDPICSSCLGEEMLTWVAEKSPVLADSFSAMLVSKDHNDLGVKCIVCKKAFTTCTKCTQADHLALLYHTHVTLATPQTRKSVDKDLFEEKDSRLLDVY